MIAKVMKGVAGDQEAREKERDRTARMDGGGLEASQHADTTQERGRDAPTAAAATKAQTAAHTGA